MNEEIQSFLEELFLNHRLNRLPEKGHDKEKCLCYGRLVRDEMQKRSFKEILKPKIRIINGENRISYPVGCALCQFGVPCTEKNPRHLNQETG